MARPQALDYDHKRQHIGQCAAACFAKAGYPSTSMADIAGASGVSKAGLYHYFTSKEAVLFDVLEGYVSQLLVLVKHQALAHLSASQRLATVIEQLLATYATAQHQHRVLVTDTQQLSPPLRERVLTAQRQLVQEMAQLLQAAYPQRIDVHNASAHAMMVFGMLNWTFTWLKADGALSYAQYAQQVIATLNQGLSEPKILN